MMQLFKKYKNRIAVICYDLTMIPIAWLSAYWLRFNLSTIPGLSFFEALKLLPALMVIQLLAFTFFKQHRGIWRFASIPDLNRIIKSVGTGTIACIAAFYFINPIPPIPRSVFPLYAILLITLLGGGRLCYRRLSDFFHARKISSHSKRVLIIGAGEAGESLARSLKRGVNNIYNPVAFIDDNPLRQGTEIQKIPVVGTCDDISKIVKKLKIDLAAIAIPSATSKQMRKMVEALSNANVKFQTLPNLSSLASGTVTLQELRSVSLEDLLGRDEVKLDKDSVINMLQGKKIVVTGGGGSIGSELCRQIVQFNPQSLVIIEHSEFNLYKIQQELTAKLPQQNIRFVLQSITDEVPLRKLFANYKPDIVFHAAAYKHVPMLQNQARCAIQNNLLGTQLLADISVDSGVKKFIFISTDKAVNPPNVMGATKRGAEIYCQNLNNHTATEFITVRFGNVLGSTGSVVPLFQKQLKKGGPITVTHPDISRYFMLIPEACQLILQAMALGHGGEIFVLDMGEPIKIKFLAEQLIQLSGKEVGKDIDIKYTGLRPGEKIYEELFHENEQLTKTKHEKILAAIYRPVDWSTLMTQLSDIAVSVSTCNEEKLLYQLKNLVPEFNYQNAPVNDAVALRE